MGSCATPLVCEQRRHLLIKGAALTA